MRAERDARGASKMARVVAILDDTYGPRENAPSGDPLDGLVGTILSQATSDVNSGRAHRALRAAYPDWQAVLDAPEGELATVIRGGGLANLKARRIKATLARSRIGAASSASTSWPTCRSTRRAPGCAPSPASGRRPPRAPCSSTSVAPRSRSTRTSIASRNAWG
jgi:endonuclease-3